MRACVRFFYHKWLRKFYRIRFIIEFCVSFVGTSARAWPIAENRIPLSNDLIIENVDYGIVIRVERSTSSPSTLRRRLNFSAH